MKIENGVTNFAVYEDATEYYGMAEVTLPEITQISEEVKGAGIAGTFDGTFVGHLEAMSLTLNFRSVTTDAIKLAEPRKHQLDLRAAQQSWDNSTGRYVQQAVKHVLVVNPKKFAPGKLAPASSAEASGEYPVTYYATYIDGKKVLVQADRAKTKSSLRTLPLVPPIRDRLLMLKGQQDTYRRLCGKSYNRDYLGYLCVDEIGNIIRPNYVSEQFPKLLEKNGLRPIRFHDLRHSCASLLLANGVPMKQIQEWLGHSDFSTTANIYAHLDYASKLSSAQAMLEGLGYGNASA